MSRSAGIVRRMRGPVVPLNVCFNEDATVDFDAVARYTGWLAESGVPIIILSSGSSEYAYLTEAETFKLAEVMARAIDGRALFVAATGWWKTTTTAEYLKHADAVGADAVKFQPHPGLKADRDTWGRYLDTVSAASDIPLLLLDPPAAFSAELAARPNVVGAKVHDIGDYYDLIRDTKDEEFSVMCAGQMQKQVFGYELGSPAYLCPIAPFLPDVANAFFDLLEQSRYDDALSYTFKYEEPWMKTAVAAGWLPAIKEAIRLRGLYPNNLPCPPQQPIAAAQSEAVRATIEEVFGPIERVDLT